MRSILACLLLFLVLLTSGCKQKPEVRYDPDRVDADKHPQSAPSSVPEAGVQALKKMKQIQKSEDQKVKEDQQTLKQADQQ